MSGKPVYVPLMPRKYAAIISPPSSLQPAVWPPDSFPRIRSFTAVAEDVTSRKPKTLFHRYTSTQLRAFVFQRISPTDTDARSMIARLARIPPCFANLSFAATIGRYHSPHAGGRRLITKNKVPTATSDAPLLRCRVISLVTDVSYLDNLLAQTIC
jgi:hypothetical protein